jgi:hypothetical protein
MMSEKCMHNSDMKKNPGIQNQIESRLQKGARDMIWSASDFADLGGREAVDKALQRLTAAGFLEKIARGLYHRPSYNPITRRNDAPNPFQVLAALERRDATPMLIDGMTAANDLGFTTAVPAKIVVHTSMRRQSIKLGGQTIVFKPTAASKLTWAGRPAMRLVQALLWLKEAKGGDAEDLRSRVSDYLSDRRHAKVRKDLQDGFTKLPTVWLQELLRPVLIPSKKKKMK